MAKITDIFVEFDKDGDGIITEHEFLKGWKRLFYVPDDETEAVLIKIFGMLNPNENGGVPIENLKRVPKLLEAEFEDVLPMSKLSSETVRQTNHSVFYPIRSQKSIDHHSQLMRNKTLIDKRLIESEDQSAGASSPQSTELPLLGASDNQKWPSCHSRLFEGPFKGSHSEESDGMVYIDDYNNMAKKKYNVCDSDFRNVNPRNSPIELTETHSDPVLWTRDNYTYSQNTTAFRDELNNSEDSFGVLLGTDESTAKRRPQDGLEE